MADFAIHVHKMRVQLALAGGLVFATGWTVGVSKFSQVLMTSAGGKFETASEQRAESFLITFGLAKAVGNLLVGAAADAHGRRVCMVAGWLAAAAMAAPPPSVAAGTFLHSYVLTFLLSYVLTPPPSVAVAAGDPKKADEIAEIVAEAAGDPNKAGDEALDEMEAAADMGHFDDE